jgi:hypothetical protein
MRPFQHIITVFLLLIPFAGSSQVEQLEFKSTFNKDSILIGDKVDFIVEAKGKGNYSLQIPPINDTIPGGFELLGMPSSDSILSGDTLIYKLRIPVTVFNQGIFRIQGIPVLIKHGGFVDTARLNSPGILVKLVEPDSTLKDIKDIKPPIREPLHFSEVAPWVGLGLLIIAIILLLYFYIRSKKQNKPFLTIFKPKEPAHIVALRELKLLEEQKEWASDNPKEYYTKLIDILRIYLEDRFGINAPEQTTSQILAEVERLEYNIDDYKETLRELLSTSDLVKFAKHVPLIDENRNFLTFAIGFVEGTKPVEYTDEVESDGSKSVDSSTTSN